MQPGFRIGHYEVIARIGAGGMGEVYRARDLRIAREVALKILPSSFASDEALLLRFEQEARSAGALNHPNIITLFDVGAHEDIPYLVMELLEGESLREKMEGGPLPLRQTIEWAVQIASGLAAAHDRNIIHRDLKPENLFITRTGRAKILDFGLAKVNVVGSEDATFAMSHSPATSPGTVMGTVGYMAPEQVRGQSVDARSDIFSFGAVLYEMLSGRRAFAKGSAVETLHSILADEVEEIAPERAVPAPLQKIVYRCLEKEPSKRFQSTHDLAFALEAVTSRSASSEPSRLSVARTRRRIPWSTIAIILAVATVLASVCVLGYHAVKNSQPQQPEVKQLTFRRGTVRSARFIPGSDSIAYGAAWEGQPTAVFQQRLDSSSASTIVGDANVLAVSSKGELALSLQPSHRYWMTEGTLARAPLTGVTTRKMLERTSFADWSPDDKLLVVHRVRDVDQLEYPVGHVLHSTPGYISYPRLSRDGHFIAFADHPVYGDNRGDLVIVDTRTGKRTTVASNYAAIEGVAWSSAGEEVWFTGVRDSGKWTLFGVNRSGSVRTVWKTPSDLILFDVDERGRALLAASTISTSIVCHDEKGDRDLSWLGFSAVWALSGDGKYAALANFSAESGNVYDAWLRPTDGSPAIHLGDGDPRAFSFDSKWVLTLVAGSPPKVVLYGVEEERRQDIDTGGLPVRSVAYWPDDRHVLLLTDDGHGRRECYLQAIGSSQRKRMPLQARGSYAQPLVASDGSRVLLPSEAEMEIYDARSGRRVKTPLLPGEFVASWTEKSNAVWVYRGEEPVLHLQRVDLTSGVRTNGPRLSVDQTGSMGPAIALATRDGRVVVHQMFRQLTDLFVVSGLR